MFKKIFFLLVILSLFVGNISPVFGEISSVDVDEVTLSNSDLREVKRVIEEIEREKTEFGIKAKLVQIVLSDEYMKGVDWAGIVSNYKNIQFLGQTKGVFSDYFSVGTIANDEYKTLLSALDTVGLVHTIYTNNLHIANNDTDNVDVRSVDLILKSEDKEDMDQVEHSSGIKFDLAPSLTVDNIVELKMSPKVKIYKERIWFDRFYARSRSKERYEDQYGIAQLELGETLVIGGLFNDVVVESASRFPFVGDLPLLGFAFRNETKQSRKAEMVLFLTPSIEE